MSEMSNDVWTTNLSAQYDGASMVWVMVSGALVWIMIPGVGLLYSGMSRKKHALSLLWASMMAICLVSFQWYFWGYSLAFGTAHSKFLGSLEHFCLMGVLGENGGSAGLPDIVFCFFQGMFAMITGCIMLGGACERARLGPMMVFLFIWMTIVYCPVAMWTWNTDGWLNVLGAYDFAGGGPVHQASGVGALAYALWCGKRRDPLTQKGIPKYRPHSVTSVVLGTVFLWFGWFGFNGGSSGDASLRGFYANVNTNLAAACGGLTWMFLDWFRCGHKWTTIGMCSGAVAGLVGITPAAGFVPVYFAVPIGCITAVCCNYGVDLKDILHIDDGMDVFAIHGIGGFIGSMLTGLFAADYVAASDFGVSINGGWINHYYRQLGLQLAACCSIDLWSFVVTSIILNVMNRIPFLKIRLSEEEEDLGTDATQIGEFTYQESNMFIPEPVRSRVVPGDANNADVNAVPLPEKSSTDEEKHDTDTV